MGRDGLLNTRPWKALTQGAPLRRAQTHRHPKRLRDPGKASAVQAPLSQPQAQAVVDEQLDAVAPGVGEGVGAVRACAAKPVDDTAEYAVKSQAHVDRGTAQVQAVQFGGEDATGAGLNLNRRRCMGGGCGAECIGIGVGAGLGDRCLHGAGAVE